MKNIIFLIPFYNEENNLIELTKFIKKSATHHGFVYKILFLNDCSSDNSFNIISNYSETNKLNNIIIHQNDKNLGHGKSLLKLFELAQEYKDTATDVVTMDSDMRIEFDDFNEIFEFSESVICKRKRFEEGIFRSLITLSAEFVVLIKTKKLWRDANCPLRLYKINTFKLIYDLIPNNILTPNIFSTIIIIKSKLPVARKNIYLTYDTKNAGVTWQGKNPLNKYIKILNFSFKSLLEVMKIKIN